MNTPDLSEQYTNNFVGTLPGQRYSFYKESDFDKMKQDILIELDKIDEALGFFNIESTPLLVEEL